MATKLIGLPVGKLGSVCRRTADLEHEIAALAIGFVFFATVSITEAQDYHAVIPRAWEDKDVQGFELPGHMVIPHPAN